jgi:lipopolysaccharide export system permease protein
VRLQFFPSRQIGWYMARLFLVRTLAVLLMLVLVLQTLDLLGESGKILSVAGNSEADLWRYVGMRAPQIIARFLPFSVLLATLITFATLSQNFRRTRYWRRCWRQACWLLAFLSPSMKRWSPRRQPS